ncbi:hypothetical protein [Sphingobium sp. DC-2]|uniref:hypothetical protein n=1 Tax=Sphingobium sp. DC-2 TaxID=1303256 RepID=UPI0004C402B4|nr:hypothetical protein [Sphingobium sp. DC-2]
MRAAKFYRGDIAAIMLSVLHQTETHETVCCDAVAAYNCAMDDKPDPHGQSKGPTRLAMVADLLAAVGSMLVAWAARRRGGPGAMRRAESIVLTLLSMAIAFIHRGDMIAMGQRCTIITRSLRRHMTQPPAGWSAP